ncbi:FitA-like ribbon-helix-helix domain-containing protein [Jiangella anatolica]|uniref:Antitoxin FitA-like ribbon-helix-helix domain-containing protein n=1 Tax=Jiangella anatolica TaxID=2670374 RepID=A0A2W2BAW0_9ACTN|nr:hypothetical protein [Jiangella anatolica]PZF84355.1 hypothetical protein C1I92_09005 [Jiangella anatolica]
MSALLQIRNVPEQARRTLKTRAAQAGKSLNSYLLDLIEREVSRPTAAEVFERAAARAESSTASAVDVLAEARAEREREYPTR